MKIFIARMLPVLFLAVVIYLVAHVPDLDRPDHTVAEVKGMYPSIRKECWEMTGEDRVDCITGKD